MRVGQNNTIEDPSNCSICLEKFDKDGVVEKIDRLVCRHIFHYKCINEWKEKQFSQGHNFHCPYCFKLIENLNNFWIDLVFDMIIVPGGVAMTLTCWLPVFIYDRDRGRDDKIHMGSSYFDEDDDNEFDYD